MQRYLFQLEGPDYLVHIPVLVRHVRKLWLHSMPHQLLQPVQRKHIVCHRPRKASADPLRARRVSNQRAAAYQWHSSSCFNRGKSRGQAIERAS